MGNVRNTNEDQVEQYGKSVAVHPEDAAWLESLAPALLRDEYPDQMAARSCSCEPDATCGAHRLLARYDALYQHMAGVNAERRDLRQRLREAAPRSLVDLAWGIAAKREDEGNDERAEAARLREEMEVVAAGLDLLISSGTDQASNLARLRDHLRTVGNGRSTEP